MDLAVRVRNAAATLIAATLVACGGGEPPRVTGLDFASRVSPQAPRSLMLRASAPPAAPVPAPSRAITNPELFAWAQATFPAIFGSAAPQSASIVLQGKTYDVRGYTGPAGVVYLGISEGVVYGLGAVTNNQLLNLGEVQTYACQAVPSICQQPPTASLNICADPTSAIQFGGTRATFVYVYSGLLNAEQTVDLAVIGLATFEGQSAAEATTTTTWRTTQSAPPATITIDSTIVAKTYHQAGDGGLIRTLGAVVDTTTATTTTIPGLPPLPGATTTIRTRTVYNPPTEDTEFLLQPGQSLDKTTTQTTTTLQAPVAVPPATTTTTVRHTFEARESIVVLGRQYDTCRYKQATVGGSEVTTTWFIVGRGVMARSLVSTAAGNQTIELKSGSFNGTPL